MSLIASPVFSNPNKDFVEAYKIYLKATEISTLNSNLIKKRFKLLKESKHKFDRIIETYPSSDLALKLITNQSIGDFKLSLLNLEIINLHENVCYKNLNYNCLMEISEKYLHEDSLENPDWSNAYFHIRNYAKKGNYKKALQLISNYGGEKKPVKDRLKPNVLKFAIENGDFLIALEIYNEILFDDTKLYNLDNIAYAANRLGRTDLIVPILENFTLFDPEYQEHLTRSSCVVKFEELCLKSLEDYFQFASQNDGWFSKANDYADIARLYASLNMLDKAQEVFKSLPYDDYRSSDKLAIEIGKFEYLLNQPKSKNALKEIVEQVPTVDRLMFYDILIDRYERDYYDPAKLKKIYDIVAGDLPTIFNISSNKEKIEDRYIYLFNESGNYLMIWSLFENGRIKNNFSGDIDWLELIETVSYLDDPNDIKVKKLLHGYSDNDQQYRIKFIIKLIENDKRDFAFELFKELIQNNRTKEKYTCETWPLYYEFYSQNVVADEIKSKIKEPNFKRDIDYCLYNLAMKIEN